MIYTSEEVLDAINAGSDLVIDAIEVTDRDLDLINFVTAAICTRLHSPTATLDDVVTENWGSTNDPRGWWDGWA